MELREAHTLVGEHAMCVLREPRRLIDGRVELVRDRLGARLRGLGDDRVGDLVGTRTHDPRRLPEHAGTRAAPDQPPALLRCASSSDDERNLAGSVRRTEPTGSSVAGLTETSSGSAVVTIAGIVRLGRDPGRDAIEIRELRRDPGREVVLAQV